VREAPWYRDREAWRLIACAYLPWLAGLNVVWEIAQLPLYTLWREATPGYIAFAVAHCTVGDLLIGTAALVIALVLVRAGPLADWPWARISVCTALTGVVYTIVSEWTNTTLFRWAYSELMPTIALGPAEIGLSPLLQWLVVPPLALTLAKALLLRREARRVRAG
jgi:hypothetical protein